MIEVHIPGTGPNVENFITKDLDAVVLDKSRSKVYPGSTMYRVAGNVQDLGIVVERASKIGGVVD